MHTRIHDTAQWNEFEKNWRAIWIYLFLSQISKHQINVHRKYV